MPILDSDETTIYIDGTALTSTATELNKLASVVAGTASASKAAVLGTNKNLDVLAVADGGLSLGAGAGTAINATASEINQWCDESAKTEVVTATNVLLAAESGKTCFLNSATEFVSTLPAPAAGLHFRFIVSAAPSGASYTIVTTSSANIILGQIYTTDVNSATDPGFATTGQDTITLVDSKSVVGDSVDVVSDGTNWFARGFCSVFDAITFTVT